MSFLFDLDGTLLDTAPDFIYVLNQIRKEEHLSPLPLAAIRPLVSHGLATIIAEGLGIPKEHPQYDHYAHKFLEYYRSCLGQHTQFFPGILNLLSILENNSILWGIVTNKPAWLTLPLLESLKLQQRAACIVSGDSTKNPKPHPEPLWHACRHMGVLAENCIFIGDAERDIQAGRAAGMTTLGALFGYITSISEALQWGADGYVYHADEIWPWCQTNKKIN